MPRVETIKTSYCPVCTKKYKTHKDASLCLEAHKKGYKEKSPKYRIGGRVLTYPFNDYQCSQEKTTIIRMDGAFTELRLLVESKDGSRYWVEAVSYQTSDFERDTAPFDFVPLAD